MSVAFVGLLSGCQSPDVGQQCTIQFLKQGSVPVDYVQFGNTECEDTLTCLRSPLPAGTKIAGTVTARCLTETSPEVIAGAAVAGTNCGYCSKPCVSNSDCFQSETGLECRQVVLDPTFINNLDPTVRQQFLGDSTRSSYCAAPQSSP